MTDWSGRTLAQVTLRQIIGQDGMAEIYLGHHLALNRLVAVKLLHGHLAAEAGTLKRFREEARAVATLRHPHIVQIHDFDVFEGRPYIVMEYIEGVSLAEVLARTRALGSRLSFADSLHLLGQLASALDYAHGEGIIHRDVKPSNVMLRGSRGRFLASAALPPDVHSVLTDFGVARVIDATSQTASGSLIGTPAYMSPEQVRGLTTDARADVYALGCMAYELVAGRLPFDPEDDTLASILFKQAYEPPPPLPGEYAGLQPIFDRALAKEPAGRYAQPGQLVEDLGRAVREGDPAHMKTARLIRPSSLATSAPVKSPVARRRRLLPILAGGVLTLGVVAGLVALASLLPPGDTPPSSTPTFQVAATSTSPQGTPATDLPPGGGPASPTPPTPTWTPTPQPTASPARSPSATLTPSATATPKPTSTRVSTATSTPTPTSILPDLTVTLPLVSLAP